MKNLDDSMIEDGYDEVGFNEDVNEELVKNTINVSVSEVPRLISENIDEIQRLYDRIEEASERAEEARSAAETAKEVEVTWLSGKKEAIEALQEALGETTEALCESSEIQMELFENQKRIGDICKKLIALGMGNLTLNRMIVREISLRLQDASEEELSDLARKELEDLVKQMKSQEDILSRLDAQKKSIEALSAQVQQSQQNINTQQNQILEYGSSIDSLKNSVKNIARTKGVLDSAAYKIIIGLVAVAALAIGVLRFLGL